MLMHEVAAGLICIDHARHRLHAIADSAHTRTDCIRRRFVDHQSARSSASLAP
jgi:hypothetical protein